MRYGWIQKNRTEKFVRPSGTGGSRAVHEPGDCYLCVGGVTVDTKFSSAIHMLILISESEAPMNSDQIAASVGTNASYIRKLTTRLSKTGIIEGHRSVSGFRMVRTPEDITLLDIYRSVMETDELHLFDLHQNPKDACIVGHNIRPVLSGMFRDMEESMERRLRGKTLADCIGHMRQYITQSNAMTNNARLCNATSDIVMTEDSTGINEEQEKNNESSSASSLR